MKATLLKIVTIIIVSSIGLFVSCRENPVKPANDPYQQWQSLKAAKYTIDQVYICYCMHAGDTLRLYVENDSIVRAISLPDSVEVTATDHYGMATIDQLFDVIKDPSIDSIVVEYHPTQGFPAMVDIEPQQHDYDGGAIIKSFNLKIEH